MIYWSKFQFDGGNENMAILENDPYIICDKTKVEEEINTGGTTAKWQEYIQQWQNEGKI